MATGKKKIVVYADWKASFDALTNEEAGLLIKHFFAYVNDENPISENRIVQLMFEPIKATLKRDLESWETTRIQRIEAGAKGGKQKVANAKKIKQQVANVAVIDSVSVNDNVNNKLFSIEDRKHQFALSLNSYLEKYGKEFLNDFYLYWTEPTLNNKKLKYELQKTWSLERRLSTWETNAKKYGTILPKKENEQWKPNWL
jgi:hypothetical protein